MSKEFGLIYNWSAEIAKVRVILRGNEKIFGEKSGLCRKRVKSERFRGLFLGPFEPKK